MLAHAGRLWLKARLQMRSWIYLQSQSCPHPVTWNGRCQIRCMCGCACVYWSSFSMGHLLRMVSFVVGIQLAANTCAEEWNQEIAVTAKGWCCCVARFCSITLSIKFNKEEIYLFNVAMFIVLKHSWTILYPTVCIKKYGITCVTVWNRNSMVWVGVKKCEGHACSCWPPLIEGEIADEELDLPPEPVLPTPVTWNGRCQIRCMCGCACVYWSDHVRWIIFCGWGHL